MPNYLSNRVKGGYYFVTVNLLERHQNKTDKNIFFKKFTKYRTTFTGEKKRGERGIWQRHFWD